jgi:hypothetical protein
MLSNRSYAVNRRTCRELLVRERATTSVLCRGRDIDGHIPVPIYFRWASVPGNFRLFSSHSMDFALLLLTGGVFWFVYLSVSVLRWPTMWPITYCGRAFVSS